MTTKKYIYMTFTSLFFLNWVAFLVLSTFYKPLVINIGLGELVSEGNEIAIIFGFFVPVAIFAYQTGVELEKAVK